jgi:hypothetical protein
VRGAPAARNCGRRGPCAGEVGAAPTTWGRLGARVGAREGGGDLGLACSRPGLELAAVASNGADRRLDRGLAGTRGQCPFLWATKDRRRRP